MVDQDKVTEMIQGAIARSGEMVPAGCEDAASEVVSYVLEQAAAIGGSYLRQALEVEYAELYLRHAFGLPVELEPVRGDV